MLLVDGRMAGLWRHETNDEKLSVSVEPLEPVSAVVRRGAEGEAERLPAFLGRRLVVAWR